MFIKLARFLARNYIEDLETVASQMQTRALEAEKKAQEAELSANRRYAEMIAKLDPYEEAFKKLSLVFTKEYTRAEDSLDGPSALRLAMWAYKEKNDPQFTYLVDWIMNSYGNEVFKAPAQSVAQLGEKALYAKAQVSAMLFLRKEVGRLSSIYEEYLLKLKGGDEDLTAAAD